MGPALLPTPLSPAVDHPEGTMLIAWRVSDRPLPEGAGHPDMSPGARAGAGLVPWSSVWSEDRCCSTWRPVRWRRLHLPASLAVPPAASCLLPHRYPAASSLPPITVYRGFSGPFRLSPKVPTFHSSTATSCHRVEIASVSVSLYRQAIQRGDPFSLSMSGECADRPSRARARACTYPLSAQLPVDKGG